MEDLLDRLENLIRDARFKGTEEAARLAEALENVRQAFTNSEEETEAQDAGEPAEVAPVPPTADVDVDEAFANIVNGDLADLADPDDHDPQTEALTNLAGGAGWEPNEYVAVAERIDGGNLTEGEADTIIAALAGHASTMLGSFEVTGRYIDGPRVRFVVTIDPDAVRQHTGLDVAMGLVLSARSAARVPNVGLVAVTSIVPVVSADAQLAQRDGIRQWRQIHGLD